MEAQPLPIRHIALILLFLGFVSITVQFFGLRPIHGWVLAICFLSIAFLLARHAWIDNQRTKFRNLQLRSNILLATIVWIPFIVVLSPAVVVSLWIDDKIDSGLRMVEKAAAGKVETIDVQIEETIQESEAVPWHFWWPPDWFREGTRIVERKFMRTVQEDVLHPASRSIRAVFAIVYAVMRVLQLLMYTSLAFIGIRSFVFLLARVVLWSSGEIEFSLP